MFEPDSLRTILRVTLGGSGRPESNLADSSVAEASVCVCRVSIARMTSYGWEVRRSIISAILAGLSAILRSLARSRRGHNSIARSR